MDCSPIEQLIVLANFCILEMIFPKFNFYNYVADLDLLLFQFLFQYYNRIFYFQYRV